MKKPRRSGALILWHSTEKKMPSVDALGCVENPMSRKEVQHAQYSAITFVCLVLIDPATGRLTTLGLD
jgi:hypothetical protein